MPAACYSCLRCPKWQPQGYQGTILEALLGDCGASYRDGCPHESETLEMAAIEAHERGMRGYGMEDEWL